MSAIDGGDVRLDLDGRLLTLEIRRASVVTPAHVQALPHQTTGASRIPVLVGDRISAAARALLHERGWSWLDLRGSVHLRAPGVLLDTTVRPRTDVPSPRSGGRAAREVCFALLRQPQAVVGVRALASRLQLSPASVSAALAQLRAASLVDRQNRPLLPELFWFLADHWDVQRVALSREPVPGDPDLDLGFPDAADDVVVDKPGWALTDTLAAVAYGARLAGSEWPPDFYVPDALLLRRAVRVLGRAKDWDDRGATAAVPPVRQVCLVRYEPPPDIVPGTHWLLADPLAVALDLAQDTARGLEILEGWTPPDWVSRVWA